MKEPTGEMEEYAYENLQTERLRIYTKLCQLLEAKEEITEEILKKLILGNRK